MAQPPSHGTLLVVGSGPGIGVHVAKVFAERGFRRVILASRDYGRLKGEAEEVRAAAAAVGVEVEVEVTTVDLAAKMSVSAAMSEWEDLLDDDDDGDGEAKAKAGGRHLEAVLFNAARVGPSDFGTFTAADLERDMQISVTALYNIATWALPKLEATGKRDPHDIARPSLLVTSGGLAKDPYPHVFSLALCKAAQYSLVWSLHKMYAPRGVHCGLVVVQGYVKPEAQVTTPRHIAEKTWELCMQGRGNFDLDVDIVDPEYKERRRKELEAQQKAQKT